RKSERLNGGSTIGPPQRLPDPKTSALVTRLSSFFCRQNGMLRLHQGKTLNGALCVYLSASFSPFFAAGARSHSPWLDWEPFRESFATHRAPPFPAHRWWLPTNPKEYVEPSARQTQ